ncbi:hypothetical protein K502DRAFT_298562 [Neoconidiobolus thromboides FSU 785]|nr:hypothetical protein K502DRAFT_298562 [Neoconidiobolus thromboides FSU 785]
MSEQQYHLSEREIEEIYEFGIELSKKGGEKLKHGFYGEELPIEFKEDDCDMVTFFDKLIENLIKEELGKRYPDHKFVGEESDSAGENWSLTNEPTWVIDPIDGTTNFVHGFPFVCISIAFVLNKKSLIGIVYNPIMNELYTACRGKGAYLNQTQKLPLRNPTVQKIDSIKQCLMMNEFGGQRDKTIIESKTKSMYRISLSDKDGGGHCRGMRSLGTAALDMCQLAKGHADIYWEVGPHVWDFAAALVIVEESGGMVVSSPGTWPNKVQLQEAPEYDLVARKTFAIRALSYNTIPSSDIEAELVNADKKKQLAIISEGLHFLEDINYSKDGMNV